MSAQRPSAVSPRLAGAAIVVPVLVFVLLVGGWLVHTRAPYAGTNSVAPRYNLPPLTPGHRLCLRGLTIPGAANGLRLRVVVSRSTSVTLRLVAGAQTVTAGASVTPGGFKALDFRFKMPPGRDLAAAGCMTTDGTVAAISGQPSASSGAGAAYLDGNPVGTPSIWYVRLPARRLVSALPDGTRHASLFRAGFVGRWLYVVLAVILILLWVTGVRLVLRGIR